MEDTFDVSAYTYAHMHKDESVDYSSPAACTNAYFSRNDPIDKPRNFTSATRSDIAALLDSSMRRDAYSSIADIKKGARECPLESIHGFIATDIVPDITYSSVISRIGWESTHISGD